MLSNEAAPLWPGLPAALVHQLQPRFTPAAANRGLLELSGFRGKVSSHLTWEKATLGGLLPAPLKMCETLGLFQTVLMGDSDSGGFGSSVVLDFRHSSWFKSSWHIFLQSKKELVIKQCFQVK